MGETAMQVEEMVAALKAAGHRLTPQRMVLLKLLASSPHHPSASQLYAQIAEQFPTTSLATVYKTLAILKELGLIREMGFSHDDTRYDVAQSEPHAHLICIQCREIRDAGVMPIAQLASRAAADSGYRIVRQRVEFYGLCPNCQTTT